MRESVLADVTRVGTRVICINLEIIFGISYVHSGVEEVRMESVLRRRLICYACRYREVTDVMLINLM